MARKRGNDVVVGTMGFDDVSSERVYSPQKNDDKQNKDLNVKSDRILKGFTIDEQLSKVITKLGRNYGRGGMSILVNQMLREGLENEDILKGLDKEKDIEIDFFEELEKKKKTKRVLKGYKIDVNIAKKVEELGEIYGGISYVAEHLLTESLKARGLLK